MTKKKPPESLHNNPQGLSERVCMPFDHEIPSSGLDKIWRKISKQESNTYILWALLLIIALLAFYIFSISRNPTQPTPTYVTNETKNINVTKNITDNSTAKYATIYSPVSNTTITVRQWSDLDYAEREALRQEAYQRFPELQEQEKRDMRPVAKWLVEEKGVITPSARDVFRER